MISTPLLSYRREEPEKSVLYVVGTPIGNFEDISFRALNILKKVSLIACEDTRNTAKLLKHYSISNKLISFHKYSTQGKFNYLISKLISGDSIALVSDAGMPSISDPGNLLVRKVRDNNLDVICVPGACAAITALVSSGIDSSEFSFYGFLPKSIKERNIKIKQISQSPVTTIIYESPKRIIKLLNELKNFFDKDREVIVLKEITKKYENHFGFNIENIINKLADLEIKGEFTIVIAGNKKTYSKDELIKKDLKKDLIQLMKAGLSHSAASNYLSQKTGHSKNYIYRLILNNDLE